MDEVLRRLANNLLESCKDLLPIVLVIAFFQFIVLKQAIPEIGAILLGSMGITEDFGLGRLPNLRSKR